MRGDALSQDMILNHVSAADCSGSWQLIAVGAGANQEPGDRPGEIQGRRMRPPVPPG